jgi:mercuric ion transport protein
VQNNESNHCCCQSNASSQKPIPEALAQKTVKSAGSVGLSILIAFFPKCPLCLAAYLSMFGSIGLARSPIMAWLLPLLISILAIHLFFLFKKTAQKGYGPFFLSLLGAFCILVGRSFLPHHQFILWAGMAFIFSGSLWNSFAFKKFIIHNY